MMMSVTSPIASEGSSLKCIQSPQTERQRVAVGVNNHSKEPHPAPSLEASVELMMNVTSLIASEGGSLKCLQSYQKD